MFFKGRREAKKRAAAEAQQQTLDGFQSEIDAAVKIDDPAARLLKLECIGEDITSRAAKERASAANWGEAADIGAAMGVGMGMLTGAFVVVSAFAFPPAALMIAVIPSVVGGIASGVAVRQKVNDSQTAKIQTLLDGLAGKQAAISALEEAVVKENLEALTASPRFAEMQERPALRDTFMAAMQRRVSGQDAPPPAPPKRPEGGLNL